MKNTLEQIFMANDTKVRELKKKFEASNKSSKPKKKANFKSGWHEIGGKRYFFRSSWEVNIAKWYEWQKNNGQIKDWLYEPETFYFGAIKRGVVSYKPDFKIIFKDDSYHWTELKGFLDSKSKTKLKRFAKYYPDEKMVLITSLDYKQIKENFCRIVEGWI